MTLIPSEKSPAMTSFLETTSGRSSAITELKCIKPPFGCGKTISAGALEMADSTTRQEYTISGLCPECQKTEFSEPDDEYDDDEEYRDLY